MDALLAIKPEFADKILSGEKEYEFRRSVFENVEQIDIVYLYSVSPQQEIVGGFVTSRIIEAQPEELWELFGDVSGIDEVERFMEYFEGTGIGYAVGIDEVYEFDEYVDPKEAFTDFDPPVSFHYLSSSDQESLRQRLADSVSEPDEVPLPHFANTS